MAPVPAAAVGLDAGVTRQARVYSLNAGIRRDDRGEMNASMQVGNKCGDDASHCIGADQPSPSDSTGMGVIDDDELRALLPSLRRFALWLARDAGDADDLVQACLERALSRGSTRRTDASLKAWLFAILHRQFIDSRRRAGRFQRLLAVFTDEREAAPSAEDTFVARSSLEAFASLGTDQRAVLLLVTVEGLDYREAAQALGVPVGTVMSRLSRARAAYRKLIGGNMDDNSIDGTALRSVK